jgi:mRNA-degrading endonuclease RelE of RelBE toxin-antitoxin system
MTEPDLFGKPLRKSLLGFRSLRVGEYRVIFLIKGKTVEVYMIAHRSRVYEDVDGRI